MNKEGPILIMRIFVEEKLCGIMVMHPEHLRIIRPCFINDGNDTN